LAMSPLQALEIRRSCVLPCSSRAQLCTGRVVSAGKRIDVRPTKDDVARQFDRMSHAYAQSPGHSHGADLDIVLDFLRPTPEMRVLDLATGPGNTAAAVAPHVREVVATDIAPGMLARAAELAISRGLTNMRTATMDAEALPVRDGEFDAATCRVAPHHFLDIDKALREIARAVRPGGVFVVEDSVAPDDPELDRYLNDLERLRDRTHVRSLNRAEWESKLSAAGFVVVRSTIYRKMHDVDDWIATSGADPQTDRDVRAMLASATPDAVESFAIAFDDAGRALRFTDAKIIFRAERRYV